MLKKIQECAFGVLKTGMKAVHDNPRTGTSTKGEIRDVFPRAWPGAEDIVWIEWENGNVHSMPIHLHLDVFVEVGE